MNVPRAGLISILMSALAGDLLAGTPQSVSPFSLTSRTPTAWVYRYVPTPFVSRPIDVEGVASLIFPEEWAAGDDSVGAPMLPVEVITLGVPAGTRIEAELRDAEYMESTVEPVAPRPSFHLTQEREGVAEYHFDSRYYSRDAFFPERPLSVEGPYFLRQANVVTIRVAPLQYNPATRTLRRLIAGSLHIRQAAQTKTSGVPAAASADPRFEPTYRSIIANYDEARAWRYRQQTSPAADSTGLWFAPGDQYLRLGVARDGWYRLTHADLAAAGLGSETFDSSRVKLLFRGKPVPLLFTGQDECFFYGMKKRGDTTHIDIYTDTSMYWMSWNAAGSGARFVAANVTASAEDRTVSESRVTLHCEENTDYYEGTGETEITTNGPIPGEGWVWEYYYPGTTRTHNFQLDHVQGTLDTVAVLRVLFYSTTLHYNTPDHIARVWINDSLAGELSFSGRQMGLFEQAIPSRWLKEGLNTLKISSVATPSTPNQFYLDWFEIDYARLHAASGNQLTLRVLPVAGSSVAKITVDGFTSSSLRVLDLTNHRNILGAEILGGAGGDTVVSFRDTISSAREYLIVSDADALPVSSAASGSFRGLRQLSGGADYVIVTHNRFRAAADQLAAHRASHNGVRTAVIDVQSIYDEFNYGHMSSESIKAFLYYAYTNWPAPALSNVLLFGDASWDFHRYMTTTVMTNYVPSYGVPASDNWYACFDTALTWIPTLSLGRLPVQDPAQAARTVDKIIGYDNYELSDWNKNFLFISGGSTAAEKVTYNAQSDASIQQYVLPASIGGTPFRVYKSTPNTIDGENIDLLRSLVANGLVFMNFLGHSGGRIWGVDIGSPYDLQNTNGKLPFVTSVSCNVGAFAEPSSNVLAEDFVLADNRAAIGMFASSSLGYANVGQTLVNLFLKSVKVDTVRAFGAATVASRIQLWQLRGSDHITTASCNLTPLIGDPLSRLAIPTKPDLALIPAEMSLTIPSPTQHDTSTQVSLVLHNYGLVPGDSVGVDLVDYFRGGSSDVLRSQRFRPTLHRDTLRVPWKGVVHPGSHTFTATLDPQFLLDEVHEENNAATFDAYVYVNRLVGVRPFMNQVVPPGTQTLVVGATAGNDSMASAYTFEVDTTSGFDSPAKMSSGSVAPGPVGARWTTPPLGAGVQYFWRAHAMDDTVAGLWLNGALSVANDVPAAPVARWLEDTQEGFRAASYNGTEATDSGVTLRATPSLLLGARSLGYRADANHDYYSTIRINKQVITGLWWEHGNSFLTVRLDQFTGAFVFKPFNVQGKAALADSMKTFIDSTRTGDYLAFSVIYDGYTNVSENLRSALRTLGSTLIDSLKPGHAWMFIARKGAGGVGAREQWSQAGVVEDSIIVPCTYAIGTGAVASPPLPFPKEYGTFRWETRGDTTKTTISAFVIGTTALGRNDTLAAIPGNAAAMDLTPLNAVVKDSAYNALTVGSALRTSDPVVTPLLTSWSMDFVPPPDLAIGTRTVSLRETALQKAASLDMRVTVFNIGFTPAESVLVSVSAIGAGGSRRLIGEASSGRIGVDSSRSINVSLSSEGFAGLTTLEVVVAPPAGQRDMIADNNTARFDIEYTSVQGPFSATMRLFADGIQLMDGDYVASNPNLTVQLVDVSGVDSGGAWVVLFVDNVSVAPAFSGAAPAGKMVAQVLDNDLQYTPDLTDGVHELLLRLYRWSGSTGTDSLERRLTVQVQSDVRVIRVFNYPNPFRSETEFTFVLTGSRAPDEVRIRIFTIAGRKIREIVVPQPALQVGFNRVLWDGRDEVGDEIANGYYLYQVQVSSAGVTNSAIEKLVKVR